MSSKPKLTCSLCNNPVESRQMASPQKLENRILDLIKLDRPEWEGKRGICPNCLETYRAKKFIGYLEAEYQKLSELEHAVVSKVTPRAQSSRMSKARLRMCALSVGTWSWYTVSSKDVYALRSAPNRMPIDSM